MEYIYKEGKDKNKPLLLLLHGTGGSEQDLLSVASYIDDQASVLSLRGDVNENGMLRFFKRLQEGIFDEVDLVERTHKLYDFIGELSVKYNFDKDNILAIGYSNGANMIGSLLFHYGQLFKGATLYNPMVPLRSIKLKDLSSTPIFIGAGNNDPICSKDESIELEGLLKSVNADVTMHWENNGHALTSTEIQASKDWYNQLSF